MRARRVRAALAPAVTRRRRSTPDRHAAGAARDGSPPNGSSSADDERRFRDHRRPGGDRPGAAGRAARDPGAGRRVVEDEVHHVEVCARVLETLDAEGHPAASPRARRSTPGVRRRAGVRAAPARWSPSSRVGKPLSAACFAAARSLAREPLLAWGYTELLHDETRHATSAPRPPPGSSATGRPPPAGAVARLRRRDGGAGTPPRRPPPARRQRQRAAGPTAPPKPSASCAPRSTATPWSAPSPAGSSPTCKPCRILPQPHPRRVRRWSTARPSRAPSRSTRRRGG